MQVAPEPRDGRTRRMRPRGSGVGEQPQQDGSVEETK